MLFGEQLQHCLDPYLSSCKSNRTNFVKLEITYAICFLSLSTAEHNATQQGATKDVEAPALRVLCVGEWPGLESLPVCQNPAETQAATFKQRLQRKILLCI